MKNMIEALADMVFLSMVAVIMMSLVLSETAIIQNRNDFYSAYEDKLIAGEHGTEVESKPFSLSIPFIGTIVDSYVIKGYVK